MQLVFQVGEAELEVEVAATAEATVAHLVEALAGGPVAAGTGLGVGDHFLAPTLPLASAGLRQGDVVHLCSDVGPARAAPPEPVAVAELRVVGGLGAGVRLPLDPGAHVLGRAGDVAVDAPTVSARHARLELAVDGSCTVEDLGSSNGTRLEGDFVLGRQRLEPGQLLQLGAVQAVLGPTGPGGAGDVARPGRPGRLGTTTFNRPPRLAALLGPAPVAAPERPRDPSPGARFGWAALVAPLVLGLAMAVVFSPVMAAFALFSPVMVVANWLEDRRRVARERARGRQELGVGLDAFRRALAEAQAAEAARRRALLPDPAETLRRAHQPSTHLWERRSRHADALCLSLGLADVPWQPPVAETAGGRPAEAEAVLAEFTSLPRTPVEVDLRPGRTVGVVGERAPVLALLRSLVVQAAVHHGPADLGIAVLASADRALDWDWAKWLPHSAGMRAGDHDGAHALAAALGEGGKGAATLVVVDAEGLTEGRRAPVRDLLGREGVSTIVVAASVDRLPSRCTTVVVMEGLDGSAHCFDPGTSLTVEGILVAGVAEPEARRCARALASFDDPEVGEEGSRLPGAVPLIPLLGHPTAEAVASRWRAADVGSSMAATVGVGEDGPLVLDLVNDGPHGLVAGTTGSGKSELLRTLVASLAAGHSPEQLTFVLIDYKGGAAFADCAGLPHVVGLVTDLDQHLGERALRCLEAELEHRERQLRQAGVSDLRDYLAAGARGGPLPRLLVVIDEFATLAAELPDFIESLVGVAQRGRSLGVHLLLATQRPSGAVSDSIRANTNLRVALRVQDVPDSTDVIGTPQAAHLDRGQAGRGFVRLGHGEVLAFQAALVTTATPADASAPVRVRPFVLVPDGGGDLRATEGPSDLGRLVDAARAAWRSAGMALPRRPWPDPLPDHVLLDELPPGALGLADEPDRQRQVPFAWEPGDGNLLLYGAGGSGTTTALASLALTLARAQAPDRLHLYVLDHGTGALAPLAGLAHAGAAVGPTERERQERLVRMLRAELEGRRRAVATGRSSAWPQVVLLADNLGAFHAAFDDVVGIGVRDELVRVMADGPPLGVVTVATADRPGAVPAAMSALFPQKLVFRLADAYDYAMVGLAARDVPRLGPGRAVDVGTRREVQVGVPGNGGLAAAVAAAGRWAHGRGGEGHRPRPVVTLPEHVALAEVAGAAELGGDEWVIPVGMGDTALSPVGLRLGEGDHALVAGPARSGKSTALSTVAAVVAGHRPDVVLTAVALRRSPLRLVDGVARLVTEEAGVPATMAAVARDPAPQLVLVDDADAVGDPSGSLASLFALRRPDVHVVAAGRADVLRTAYGHWVVEVRRSRQGLALRPQVELDGELWQTVLPRRRPAPSGPGRGYLVLEGQVELIQTAAPAVPTPSGPHPGERA